MSKRRGGDQIIPRPDTWRYGTSPPWMLSTSATSFPPDKVEARISRFESAQFPQSAGVNDEWLSTARESAVLVPLITTPDGVSVVLTRRANHLKNHRGEVSFPGGRVEESESVVEAALREASEEIALHPTDVRIIGQLDPHATFVSNSLIVPVVGMITGTPTFVAQPAEVARIFVVPLHELAHADSYHNEWWVTARGEINIHFFYLDDETIWGATGRILRQLCDVVLSTT